MMNDLGRQQKLISENRIILGISNTYLKGNPWLIHVEKAINKLIERDKKILILPYALQDIDWYADKLKSVFRRMGYEKTFSLHHYPNEEEKRIRDADAIFIAGGNTSRLLANLHSLRNADGSKVDHRTNATSVSIIGPIRKAAQSGTIIMGSSAGLNVICNDIRTTNDMHLAVQNLADGKIVSRVDALGLLPSHLSINPHFLDKVELNNAERALLPDAIKNKVLTILDHQGEARIERLERAIQIDPKRKILALREGAYFIIRGNQMTLHGKTGGFVLQNGAPPKKVIEGMDLSDLLVKPVLSP